ncbi:MAG: hypothetical protein GC162_08580 [Planctomycetes bacterium]|nr:hypothetical protein [Planctomycetota bacterium]
MSQWSFSHRATRAVAGFALALALAVIATPAHAAYDGFETYTSGASLNGQNGGVGWTSAWTTSATTTQSVMLDDPNGRVDGGAQAARVTGATADIVAMRRDFTAMTGTVYLSVLITVHGFDNGDFLALTLSDGAVSNDPQTLSIGYRNNPNNPLFARVGDSGSGNTINSLTLGSNDVTFFLIGKFSLDGSNQYGHTDLFINPTNPYLEGTPDASATSTQPSITKMTRFSLRAFNLEAGDTITVDEIRITDNYAEAFGVPTPAALPAGLALLAMLPRRRR